VDEYFEAANGLGIRRPTSSHESPWRPDLMNIDVRQQRMPRTVVSGISGHRCRLKQWSQAYPASLQAQRVVPGISGLPLLQVQQRESWTAIPPHASPQSIFPSHSRSPTSHENPPQQVPAINVIINVMRDTVQNGNAWHHDESNQTSSAEIVNVNSHNINQKSRQPNAFDEGYEYQD